MTKKMCKCQQLAFLNLIMPNEEFTYVQFHTRGTFWTGRSYIFFVNQVSCSFQTLLFSTMT